MNFNIRKIVALLLLVVSFFVLVACNESTPKPTDEEKAVPVYQGMVVSDSISSLSIGGSISPNAIKLSNIGVTRNLNTNPIDQDDPFGTLDDGTISEVVTTEFPVTQTEVADYYSEINKDIFITVKLSNPDNFVILSFTLNGVFYQSYQFQDGSDSENLILKVNTGTVSGVKEYTIDAIKYIDGTDIKDAIFAGERTITVGLKHSSEPSVLVSNEVVNATSILLTVNLSDSQSLSTLNKIVLYDGASLIQIYDLVPGENNIVFDKLNINTLYQYAVISIYDLIDGNNSRLSILAKKALYTDDIVSIDNVVPTQTSIGFGITVTDVDQVGSVSAIELFQGETLVEALTDLSVIEFTGLLSNNEYQIKVTYTYDLNDGVGSQVLTINQSAKTLAKATPTVVIDNVVPTQTSIGFGITVTDVDQVGSVSAIELYQGETLVEALTDLSVREFTGLLSNNEYTVKVTYTYDLNDGVGSQSLTINQTGTTVAKATPTVVIDNVVPTQTSIGFGITVIDVDQVGSVSAIELFQGETLVEALTDLSVREFTGLLSNNEYTIKVTYTYDLNDGFSILILTSSIASRTMIEEVVITNIQVMNSITPSVGDSVSLKINFENPSQVIFNKFVINGMTLDVLFSNSNSGIVQFIPNSDGGEYSVNIEKLHYNVDGEVYIYTFSYAFETHFNILGVIDFVDFYGNNEKIYISGDTTDYFILELSNFSNFNVYSLTLEHSWGTASYSFEEIEMIDYNHYRIVNKFGSTWSTGNIVSFIRLKSIEYGYNDTEIYSKNFDSLEYKVFYNTISQIIRQITNINDLQNMENGYIYELTSDLDLSNVAWTPYEFYGVILGNGYSINNLNIFNLNTSSSEQNYGLFTMFGGLIQDLTINNPNVYIKTNGRVNYGTIAASTNMTTYKNVSVSGANVIIESIESVDFSGLGRSYNIFNVGISNSQFIIKGKNIIASGIATGSSLIIDAYFENSSIEVTASGNARVSGISSGMYIENTTINDVTLKTIAQGNVYLGGIASENSYGINDVSIHNLNIIIVTEQIAKVGSIAGIFSYGIISKASVGNVSMTIKSKTFSGETTAAGLLVGQTSDNSHIINSYASNSTINIEGIDMWIGGLVGFLYSGKLENSYAYNNQIIVDSTAISNFGVVVGGLIGSFGSDQPFLNNSIAIKGSITVTSSSYTQVDYLTGRTTMATINNSYVFADCEVVVNGVVKENSSSILISYEGIVDFYLITLGWSESVWDFSHIDYLNGILPILK